MSMLTVNKMLHFIQFTIKNSILTDRLEKYGIRSTAGELTNITKRQYLVKVNSRKSSIVNVITVGMSQKLKYIYVKTLSTLGQY